MSDDSQPITPPVFEKPAMSEADQRNWAMAAHLSALVAFFGVPSLIGPLVVWLIKKDESPYVAAHGLHALNFNISVLIYTLAAMVVTVILGLVTIGIGLVLAIPVLMMGFVAWLIFVILGAVAASRGEEFTYPWTINLVN